MEKELKKRFEEIYSKEWEIPGNLQEHYQILSCLKYTKERQVYLIEERDGSQKKILKCGKSTQAELLKEEYRYLQEMSASFFPKVDFQGEEKGFFYFVREYIEGKTLYELINEKETLEEQEAAKIILEIGKMIHTLHFHTPKIIYRDMKPQNIVKKRDGSFCCIDFDSIRVYKEKGEKDTICLGTRGVASPEQYGFMQTDERTDIYGLGMLLLYLVTGDYKKEGEVFKKLSPKMNRIIEKATQFNPKHRYQQVKELEKALKSFLRRKKKVSITFSKERFLIMLFLCMGCIVLGIFIGLKLGGEQREIDKSQQIEVENNQRIEFNSPLVEEAVRMSLNRPEGEILQKDLEQISSLYICGEKTFTSWDAHLDYHSHYFFELKNTNAISAELLSEDLSHFHNLTTLVIDGQGLQELPKYSPDSLERISLSENEISDISSLENQGNLKYLSLEKNPIRDLEPLQELSQLEFVNVSQTNISELSGISGSDLKELQCIETGIDNGTILEYFPNLEILYVSNADEEMVQDILKLSSLQGLGLIDSQVYSLEDFSVLPKLTGLELSGCKTLTSLKGAEKLKNITYLGVGNTGITQVPEAFYMEKLEELELTNNQIMDYSPLENCKRLRILFMDGDSLERVSLQFPEKKFEIISVN